MDDFIFIAGSEQECREQVRKFRAICSAWGVQLKEIEDCGPAQVLTALGVEYDLVRMTRRITPGRVQQLDELLREARTSRERAHWEKLTGVLWYVVRCVPLGTPHLQPIMEATIRARKQRRPVAPTATTMDALHWWTLLMASLRERGDGEQWHGEDIIPVEHATASVRAMGDAGSEWGIGGHDGTSYFKATGIVGGRAAGEKYELLAHGGPAAPGHGESHGDILE